MTVSLPSPPQRRVAEPPEATLAAQQAASQPTPTPRRPLGALGSWLRTDWPWVCYLLVIAAAELSIAFWEPWIGIVLHVVMLFVLPIHATLAPPLSRPLLMSLGFAPLIRIVSLALPLGAVPLVTWYLAVSAPLYVAAVSAIRVLGLSRRDVGLSLGRLPVQIGIALLGIPLGWALHLATQPPPLIEALTWQTVLGPSLVFLVATGFLEELIFRGLLQSSAVRVLAGRGLVFVSAIFALLHIGSLSVANVVLAFAAGLSFAWLVATTRSILGVSLAHGLANIVLYLVLPVWALQPAAAPVFEAPLPSAEQSVVEPGPSPTLPDAQVVPPLATPAAPPALVTSPALESPPTAVPVPTLGAPTDETQVRPAAPGVGVLSPPNTAGGPAAPAPAPPTASPAPVPTAASNSTPSIDASAPVQSVVQFYQAFGKGDFGALAAVASARMRASGQVDARMLGQRLQADQLTLEKAEVASVDEAAGRAVVNVSVLEVIGPYDWGRRRYVGTWSLVRGPDGWLLDEPNLELSSANP